MARTGLYKSEVKKARDALIAYGKHPSVDAVRIELGNTGSKTTIHKYLRELEDEEGADGGKASVSEAIQDLVERLASQLQNEANAQIDAIRAQAAENQRLHSDEIEAVRKELLLTKERLEHTEQKLELEAGAHAGTRNALNEEAIARHTARQEATGLKERLNENEAHRASLEEKHQHARDALEHYRQSVKEQRDQDQRRHEQQAQQLQAEIRQLQQSLLIKQDDLTRLNREGAQLVADLSHARGALHEEKLRSHQADQSLKQLPMVEQRCKALEQKILEKESLANELNSQLTLANQQIAQTNQKVQALELAVAVAQTKLESQQALGAELRAFLGDGVKIPSKRKNVDVESAQDG